MLRISAGSVSAGDQSPVSATAAANSTPGTHQNYDPYTSCILGPVPADVIGVNLAFAAIDDARVRGCANWTGPGDRQRGRGRHT